MAKRYFCASHEPVSVTTMLKLGLDTDGPIPIDGIKLEFLFVAKKHLLHTTEGLFEEEIMTVDGPTLHQLSGHQ